MSSSPSPTPLGGDNRFQLLFDHLFRDPASPDVARELLPGCQQLIAAAQVYEQRLKAIARRDEAAQLPAAVRSEQTAFEWGGLRADLTAKTIEYRSTALQVKSFVGLLVLASLIQERATGENVAPWETLWDFIWRKRLRRHNRSPKIEDLRSNFGHLKDEVWSAGSELSELLNRARFLKEGVFFDLPSGSAP